MPSACVEGQRAWAGMCSAQPAPGLPAEAPEFCLVPQSEPQAGNGPVVRGHKPLGPKQG